MVKAYKKGIQLSEHFNSNEFACQHCNIIKIDKALIDLLELLFKYMNAYKIIITSGYRCNDYELSLKGGVKNGYHTKGMAVDINVWKNGKERFTSQEICLALEDLGWNHGIGIISNTAVHIDTRTNKYWFDERRNCVSIGNSFYTYFAVKNNRQKVKERFGLEEETMEYLDKYKYSKDLYKKLIDN